MVKIKVWKVILILIQTIYEIAGSTHWVVTENGRIQSHVDSPFFLRRPYDLLALLDQEYRKHEINNLYQDLVSRKSVIDKKWSGLEGASDVETRVYTQDADCLNAGVLLSEIDLFSTVVTNGSHRGLNIELEQEDDDNEVDLVPDCGKYSDLDYSMFTYEHLQPMIDRRNLTLTPRSLKELEPATSAQFAEQVALALRKNSSSWVHYNLGAMYWRVVGDGPKAVECIRRALYYVPYEYRDIPLLTLAGIFHTAKYSKEAALILHAAIDHAPYEPLNYLALGHVYTVLTDYNRSVLCYDNILKLKPDFQDVIIARHATLCHQKLESGLMNLHEALQDILTELHDYHSQQQKWLRLQERLMWEQAPIELQIVGYNVEKLSVLAKRGQRCVQRNAEDSKSTISCDFNENQLAADMQFDITLNFQRLLLNVENEAQKINEQMARNKRTTGIMKQEKLNEINDRAGENLSKEQKMPTLTHSKYPPTMSTSSNLYFDTTGWPSKDDCSSWNLPLNEQDDLNIPVFLPPENKGYQISKMLSEYIDIPDGAEHELPWYPPICKHTDMDRDESYLPSSIRRVIDKPLKVHPALQKQLLKYVNDGKAEEAEIGQRIVLAMRKKSGPAWILGTLASLYWRIRANTKNALTCLDLPLDTVPKEHTDVVLVSMGSIFHQLGLIEDAIKFASLAFKMNYVEPSTSFLLALLHYTKNNPILAMYYMKNVLRVDPEYYDGKADYLLRTWACRIKMGNYEDAKAPVEKPSEGMCGERDSFNGEGVICSPNGDQCKTAAIQCVRANTIREDGETNKRPIPKILSTAHCSQHKIGVGESLISTLLAAEGSGVSEPDQSQLESMVEHPQQAFHMRISLGDEHMTGNTLGDFYVSVSLTDDAAHEPMLHVYDKSGKYPLSNSACRDIKDADWLHFTSMWQSIAARNVDIGPFLKPLPKSLKEYKKPHCSDSIPSSSATLDHLIAMVLKGRLPSLPETSLSEWLGLMAGDQQASLRELGTKISTAMQENTTSWILATAAALYWRVLGSTEEAITCLRQALTYVPSDMKDIPLISLANVLHRVGFHGDALEVAYIALDSKPDFVVNHFTAGNIHTTLGDLEKAISFYRSSLALDANFEPARNRLQAILCTFLFDESGSLRDITDVSEN